jgi:hypothetical protein
MFSNQPAPRSILRRGPEALFRAYSNNIRSALKRGHRKFSAVIFYPRMRITTSTQSGLDLWLRQWVAGKKMALVQFACDPQIPSNVGSQ